MSRIPSKPRGNPSSVQSRIAGSSPELGRLARISNTTGLPKRRRRSGRSRSRQSPTGTRGNDGAVMRRWLMLFLIAGGTIFSLMLMWSLLRQSSAPESSIPLTLDPSATSFSSAPPLLAEEALERTGRMLSAKSPESLSTLLRKGSLDTEQAFAFLTEFKAEHGEPRTPRWLGTGENLTLPTENLLVTFEDGERRIVSFTPNEDHRWEIDFDAFAGHCEPSIDQLAQGEGNEGMVRVVAVQDHFYNTTFKDDDNWVCYALRNGSSETTLFGYCKEGGMIHKTILAVEKRVRTTQSGNGRSNKATAMRLALGLTRTSETSAKQFEISRVLADDWLLSDLPLDELVRSRIDE